MNKRGARSKYVDVMNPSGSGGGASSQAPPPGPPPPAMMASNSMPSFFIPQPLPPAGRPHLSKLNFCMHFQYVLCLFCAHEKTRVRSQLATPRPTPIEACLPWQLPPWYSSPQQVTLPSTPSTPNIPSPLMILLPNHHKVKWPYCQPPSYITYAP